MFYASFTAVIWFCCPGGSWPQMAERPFSAPRLYVSHLGFHLGTGLPPVVPIKQLQD